MLLLFSLYCKNFKKKKKKRKEKQTKQNKNNFKKKKKTSKKKIKTIRVKYNEHVPSDMTPSKHHSYITAHTYCLSRTYNVWYCTIVGTVCYVAKCFSPCYYGKWCGNRVKFGTKIISQIIFI